MKTIKTGSVLAGCLIFLLVSGCDSSSKNSGLTSSDIGVFEHVITVIDGCEYIGYKTAYNYWNITHKGDCKNPIHR